MVVGFDLLSLLPLCGPESLVNPCNFHQKLVICRIGSSACRRMSGLKSLSNAHDQKPYESVIILSRPTQRTLLNRDILRPEKPWHLSRARRISNDFHAIS
jgi:hypothetical protein